MVSATAEVSKVVVESKAFCSMTLHALAHPHDVVHGLLLGSYATKTITVDDAVPISHGTPTLPLIETAIGLLEVQSDKGSAPIVGWYTAPMHLEDKKPGPVAMRMASNFEANASPSSLICLETSDKGETTAVAYGKDFGKQYQEPIKTTVDNDAVELLEEAKKNSVSSLDLMDNMEDPSSAWYPNEKLGEMTDSVI
mmetsp:Transcript_7904/g.17553  ORF Transcript_7904/g.17553 Transcript_7904/m.17553 type:complete len:196 (+) Transcript_7904:78-665(+)